jgi:hypothetical protein
VSASLTDSLVKQPGQANATQPGDFTFSGCRARPSPFSVSLGTRDMERREAPGTSDVGARGPYRGPQRAWRGALPPSDVGGRRLPALHLDAAAGGTFSPPAAPLCSAETIRSACLDHAMFSICSFLDCCQEVAPGVMPRALAVRRTASLRSPMCGASSSAACTGSPALAGDDGTSKTPKHPTLARPRSSCANRTSPYSRQSSSSLTCRPVR